MSHIVVGTIGHIDASRIIAALDSIGLVDGHRLIVVGQERLEPIELSITDLDRLHFVAFEGPPMCKRIEETWRERRHSGDTGVAKARRQAKKRRSRR